MCAHLLTIISIVLIVFTFPLSLCCVIKVVQVRRTKSSQERRVVVKPIVNIGLDLVHYQSTSPVIGKS